MYRNVLRRADAKTLPGLLIFRLDSDLFFINADYCAERIRHHVAAAAEPVCEVSVSYTHLDVYKRQTARCANENAAEQLGKKHTHILALDQ